MNGNTNVERLLPSLNAFLSADPAPLPTSVASPSPSATVPGDGTHESATQADILAASYTRWRRCIVVWRRVIGNDILFLTLLLHAGCLWSPDYDALHAAKAVEYEASANTIARSRTRSSASSEKQTSVRRGRRRGFLSAAELAAHATRAAEARAATAEAHARVAAACPSSMWALHVLHFLRVEEVYTVPLRDRRASPQTANGKGHTGTGTIVKSLSDEVKDEGELSENNEINPNSSSTSRSSSGSDSGSSDSSDSGEGSESSKEENGDADRDGADKNIANGKRTRAHVSSGNKAKRNSTSSSNTHPRRSARLPYRKRVKFEDEVSFIFDAPPPRSLAASSSLLPKMSAAPNGNKKEQQSHLEASLAALQHEQAEREKHRGGHGAVSDKTASHPATHAHALLLRATVTLISEEEPLVQQVAAALVEDWLGFFTPTTAPSSAATPVEGCARDVPSRSDDPRTSSAKYSAHAEDLLQHQEHQREARHYWLSCLLKLAGYLDGAHSALREENLHLSAVMARQGIATHEAEETFTKSLPAILNCVLVEEVMHTSFTSHTSVAPSLSPQLWMPPPLLLLPFHFLARGSRIAVWVPTSDTPNTSKGEAGAASTSPSSSRVQGRCLSFTMHSHGLYLRKGPLAQSHRCVKTTQGREKETKGPPTAAPRLVFDLRSVEPEAVADARARPWMNALLPRHAPSPSSAAPESLLHAGEAPKHDGEESQAVLRWWCCTQPGTAGCPRVDLYVARTLVMVPIPAQSVSDSTSNPTDGPEHKSSSNSVPGQPSTASRSDATSNDTETSRRASERSVRPRRESFGRRRQAPLTREEAAVRRRHPHLFHPLQASSLRGTSRTSARGQSSSFAGRSSGGGGSVEAAPLVLLYGLARGEEATVLRHMGFSVRSGSHHGLGRGGGPAGGGRTFASTASFSADYHDGGDGGSSFATATHADISRSGSSGGSKGGSGRLTLARDALGTTLEGLYLMARRLMSLQGLYAATADVAAASSNERGDGLGQHGTTEPVRDTEHTNDKEENGRGRERQHLHSQGKGVNAGSHEERPRVHGTSATATYTTNRPGSATSITGPSAATAMVIVTPAQEAEILGTAASTLVLMALLLSHNLVDELLVQTSLVLWTTELASYILDVSLFMPRPVPRLLKADGYALSLLLQPAQSLLLMVGLVATLVTREVQHTEVNSASMSPTAAVWHPWWTAFRGAVLRDATLPSCLHSGVWVLVTKAEDAVALAAAQARWDTSKQANMSTDKDRTASGAASNVNRSGSAAAAALAGARGGRGRRLLHLNPITTASSSVTGAASTSAISTSIAASTSIACGGGAQAHPTATETTDAAASAVVLPGHRLQLLASLPAATSHAAATQRRREEFPFPRWLCGPAVLTCSPSLDQENVPMSIAQVQALRVLSAEEMAFLEETTVWTTTSAPSHACVAAPLLGGEGMQSTAAASALWLSLEATCLQWPTPPTAP